MPRPFSILLAEDDDPLRDCLVELLLARGWTVHPAGSGTDAVAVARKVRLDFSILDMHLPGMTGLDVFRTIATEIGPLPSIMMSGQATAEERAAALSLGIDSFLRKPLELSLLRRSLDDLIGRHFRDGGWRPPRLS